MEKSKGNISLTASFISRLQQNLLWNTNSSLFVTKKICKLPHVDRHSRTLVLRGEKKGRKKKKHWQSCQVSTSLAGWWLMMTQLNLGAELCEAQTRHELSVCTAEHGELRRGRMSHPSTAARLTIVRGRKDRLGPFRRVRTQPFAANGVIKITCTLSVRVGLQWLRLGPISRLCALVTNWSDSVISSIKSLWEAVKTKFCLLRNRAEIYWKKLLLKCDVTVEAQGMPRVFIASSKNSCTEEDYTVYSSNVL